MRRNIGVEWAEVARAAESRDATPLFLAVTCLLGALAWWAHHQGVPWQLSSGDAYEYAEMARRLAQGKGFTTGVIYPAELWLGAGADHPAVKFPPLWPLVLAGPFAVFGASGAVAHGVVGLVFATLVATCAALASRLAARGAGVVAALAVATSPQSLLLSMDAVSEPLFALTLAACFLLVARESRPVWIGVCCGLAYLTRYQGAVLLPMVLVLLWWRGAGLRALAFCVGGFLALASPWWLRNVLVVGDPFYSLLNLNLYIAPVMTRLGGSLFFQLEPDFTSSSAAAPLEKARAQFPQLLAALPYASANLAAFVGVAWGCWRRDRLCLGFAFCAAATLGVVAFALALGRYFVPLLPVMLVLGVVAWQLHGGRLRILALALLLLAPVLPALPKPLPDLQLLARWVEFMRGEGQELPPALDPRVASCLEERPLLLAQDAARLVWQHDVVAIYAPVRPRVVARILDEQPVGRVQLVDRRRVLLDRLSPSEECGPDWFVPVQGAR